MNKAKLKDVLKKHALWIANEGGVRADLAEANLRGAYLCGADLTRADLTRADLAEADLCGANLTGANLTGVNLRGADLHGANLLGANLRGANLAEANLTWARVTKEQLLSANLTATREHFLSILEANPNEVAALRTALVEGKIEGLVYARANAQGEFCGCLVGTIANAKKVSHKDLSPDSNSPAERWFLAIRRGDTHETSAISAITLGWLEEFNTSKGIN
jgi:uncharacterized protein YjbI with pentapeptide repeats